MNQGKESSLKIEKLVKACLANDRKAQIQLYELYARRMYNTSLRIVQDTMLAEDIVQESFLKAFTSLAGFRNEVPFMVWLRRIVINKSLDALRKRKEFLLMDENLLPEIATSEEENYTINHNEESVRKIKQAMNELSDGYRVIFSLYFFEGYDHDEIAQILDVTASTSRSQLARAKKKILEKINCKNNNHD
jgi:RNA polymerase sigma factor (sigma-70 family)